MTEKPNLNEQSTEVEVTENLSIGSYASGETLQVAKPTWYMPEWLKALIALVPALFFLIIFMIYPIINTFLLSFLEDFNWIGGSGSSFAIINWAYSLSPDFRGNPAFWSFNNYVNVLSDPGFTNSLLNTAIMVIVSVPLTIVISLLLAVCLNSIKVLQGFYQTVFFLPYVTNSIALGMVFNVMFSKGGPINSVFGLDFNWLLAAAGASRWSMFFVITIYSVWNGLAFKILVFMSGLATIDKQYYDAARIDGASKMKIFSRITVPLLSPQILYITITSFIGAFKAYTSVIALFGNGAYDFGGTGGKEWMTVVGYVYIMMQRSQIGRAAAASIILLIVILTITLVQTLVSKKRVHY